MTTAGDIPNKLHFKIGEVSRIAGVKAHVLRYWEREFSALHPQKSPSKQRIYGRHDVEIVLLIKQLLYAEGFTIAGANQRVHEILRARREGRPDVFDTAELLRQLRSEIEAIVEILDADDRLDDEPRGVP